ncbi:uncharacterized protein LOC134816243 [Bolinopsis microptera]|uniref:uncharacterized protein LOC134816243 n=1 Tax=Bolinopsis microptera TaxID=2820187 RepID=UPI00307970B3
MKTLEKIVNGKSYTNVVGLSIITPAVQQSTPAKHRKRIAKRPTATTRNPDADEDTVTPTTSAAVSPKKMKSKGKQLPPPADFIDWAALLDDDVFYITVMAAFVKLQKLVDELNNSYKGKDLKTEQELLKEWKNRQSKEKSERERLLGKYKSSKIPRVVTSHRPVEMNVGKQIVAGGAAYQPPKPR